LASPAGVPHAFRLTSLSYTNVGCTHPEEHLFIGPQATAVYDYVRTSGNNAWDYARSNSGFLPADVDASPAGSKDGQYALTADELRNTLTDDEIIKAYDLQNSRRLIAVGRHGALDPSMYLDELARRDAKRQGDRIEALTVVMANLTWIVTALTSVTAIAAIWTAFRDPQGI